LLHEEVIFSGFESKSPKSIALVQVFAKRKEAHGINDVDRDRIVLVFPKKHW